MVAVAVALLVPSRKYLSVRTTDDMELDARDKGEHDGEARAWLVRNLGASVLGLSIGESPV